MKLAVLAGRGWKIPAAILLVLALVVACATSPTGRRQLLLFSGAQVDQMGVAAFEQIKEQQAASRDARINRHVQCVADALFVVLPEAEARGWEVVVFDDDSANAFALPGRRIGVHTGLLKVAVNDAQLAAVVGHEIGHVQAQHGGERLSLQFAADTGQQLVAALLGGASPQRDAVMAALGVGAQVGVLLPYGRTQEREADLIGLRLMAEAGFDPRESIQLWRNMSAGRDGAPPEFLSTHPSHDTRIRDLEAAMPDALARYERARAQGRRPACPR